MRLLLVVPALIAASVLGTSAGAEAAPGDLDATFGGGRVVVPLGTDPYATGLAVQPDGRIVVAGFAGTPNTFVLARLLPDGSLDSSFGGDGIVTTPVGAGNARAQSVAVQPDGKLVAAGETGGAGSDFAFARYNPDGSLDGGFGGGDGLVVLPVGTLADVARSVAVGPAGQIVATGESTLSGGGFGAGVAVLEPDGEPDTGFAGDGTTVVTTDSAANDRGAGVAIQADGRIVIADSTGGGVGDGFTIVRLLPNGLPDLDFAGDGVVETPIPGEGGAMGGRVGSVLLQPDGKVVAGGYGFDWVGTPPDPDVKFAIARYTPSGALDPSFGGDGIETLQLTSEDEFGSAVGRGPDGRLVLSGTYDPDPRPLFGAQAPALARFNEDGTLDASFGAAGTVVRPLQPPSTFETLEHAVVQPDGRIVTVGVDYPPSPSPGSVVVTRYVGNPDQPAGPTPILEPPPPGTVSTRPDTNMRRIPRSISARKLKGFSGTASDPDGVRQVQIALVRLIGGAKAAQRRKASCRLLRSNRARFKRVRPRRGRCSRSWLAARGTTAWTFKLRRQLPEGRYVVYSRAIDAKGLAETSFSARDRNRYAFRVPR